MEVSLFCQTFTSHKRAIQENPSGVDDEDGIAALIFLKEKL